jgi:hypothetical protein
VATHGLVLVCGGTDGEVDALDSCLAWNLTETAAVAKGGASWSAHSFMNEGRLAGAVSRIGNTVYVSGGSEEAYGVEHLDPAVQNSVWRYGPNLPAGVRSVYGHCSLAWGEDGFLFLGGVYTASEIIVSRDVLLYNRTTDRWSAWPSLLTRRRNLACARLANSSRILVVGGDNNSGDSEVGHLAEILDVNQAAGGVMGTWRPVGRTVQARKGGQLAVVNGGRIVLTGGYSAETGAFLDSMEEFSLETESWTLLDQKLGLKRGAHGLVTIPDTYC